MEFANRDDVELQLEHLVEDFKTRFQDMMEGESLSFIDLASRTFRHPTKFYRWLHEDAPVPATESLLEVALTTNVSLDWLLLGEGKPFRQRSRTKE